MSIVPTLEQKAVVEFARNSRESLLVNALAGSAKTTTLVLAAQAMPLVPTLCCAFNKKIAVEMATRLPSHIQCATLNSLGHRVWGSTLGKRLNLESDKLYAIFSRMVEKARPEERALMGEAFASVLRATRMAKSAGYVPDRFLSMGRTLCTQDELAEAMAPQLDSNPDDQLLFWMDQVLETSIAEAYEGKIDFDDQIYMSTLFGGLYPRFPTVMVDEAQDLSPLNHETLAKMVGERLIAVGDPFQSIYAFRGADHNSMGKLSERFNMTELSLSVSFRCPVAVVELARSRAPNMEYPSWAKPGKVEHLPEWSASTIPDDAVILCRANAPLFRTALRLLKGGRSIKLGSQDIVKALMKVMEKLGPKDLSKADTLVKIREWHDEQVRKSRESRKAAIRDRADCMRVFMDGAETLGDGLIYARHLAEAAGAIQLMTGHKSKGLEWDTVFILDSFLIPSKWAIEAAVNGEPGQLEQEKNLLYVMQTRSKNELYFINSEVMK